MDEDLIRLLQRRLVGLRGQRDRPTASAFAEVRNRSSGSVGHGRFPVELDDAAARELDERAGTMLEALKESLAELEIPWSEATGRRIEQLAGEELQRDFDELYSRLEALAKVSRGSRVGELTKTFDRAQTTLTNDIAILVAREERHRVPLDEQLAAPRYDGVRRSWQKSLDFLNAAEPDYENAVKETVAAIEQLSRLVVRRPTATLGEAIRELRQSGAVQPPLLKGLEELWGWASSEDGVRHGASAGAIDPALARLACRQGQAAMLFLLEEDRG